MAPLAQLIRIDKLDSIVGLIQRVGGKRNVCMFHYCYMKTCQYADEGLDSVLIRTDSRFITVDAFYTDIRVSTIAIHSLLY